MKRIHSHGNLIKHSCVLNNCVKPYNKRILVIRINYSKRKFRQLNEIITRITLSPTYVTLKSIILKSINRKPKRFSVKTCLKYKDL